MDQQIRQMDPQRSDFNDEFSYLREMTRRGIKITLRQLETLRKCAETGFIPLVNFKFSKTWRHAQPRIAFIHEANIYHFFPELRSVLNGNILRRYLGRFCSTKCRNHCHLSEKQAKKCFRLKLTEEILQGLRRGQCPHPKLFSFSA